MSMMRLRRDFFPVRDYNRATRGMGKVSMLRLKKGSPSYMRLKKMTQMRLKKMTQMRLKKSGSPQFSNNYVDDDDKMVRKFIFLLLIVWSPQFISHIYDLLIIIMTWVIFSFKGNRR